MLKTLVAVEACAPTHPAIRLPSVDKLLAEPAMAPLLERFGRTAALDALRRELGAARHDAGRNGAAVPSAATLIEKAGNALEALFESSLKPVFNLSGTVLHTNLGRALLTQEAAKAVADVLTRASNLEYDLETGRRGERDAHIEGLICRLTGAEAATIVNNNAAAVMLVLNTVAAKKEVLVSRGELVEIGGAFRVPDVMRRAGCRLVEVGTTNRTHLRDYEDSMGPRTAAAMKVHQSNYEIRGFTAEAEAGALAALCRARGVIFIDDLGSGNLVDLSIYGLAREPTVGDALRHADLVTFSGDKLLGGVQCGIIAGRKDLIAKVNKNSLKRALRVDKMTIAAMESILRLYLDPDRLAQRLPALRMITRPHADIEAQARRLAPLVAKALEGVASAAVVACSSQIGSGALPVETLPSAALALTPPAPVRSEGAWLKAFAARLRRLPQPVIGRTAKGAYLLDLRTLEDEDTFLAQIALLPGIEA